MKKKKTEETPEKLEEPKIQESEKTDVIPDPGNDEHEIEGLARRYISLQAMKISAEKFLKTFPEAQEIVDLPKIGRTLERIKTEVTSMTHDKESYFNACVTMIDLNLDKPLFGITESDISSGLCAAQKDGMTSVYVSGDASDLYNAIKSGAKVTNAVMLNYNDCDEYVFEVDVSGL